MGDDRIDNGVAYSNHGTSEVVMRSQFAAWKRYMQSPPGRPKPTTPPRGADAEGGSGANTGAA
jgi:hypothetical protein